MTLSFMNLQELILYHFKGEPVAPTRGGRRTPRRGLCGRYHQEPHPSGPRTVLH